MTDVTPAASRSSNIIIAIIDAFATCQYLFMDSLYKLSQLVQTCPLQHDR